MYQSTAATLIYFRWNLVLHKAAYLVPSDLSFTDIKFITIIKYILVERVRVAELLSNSVGVDLQCTLLICSHAFEILRLYMCTEKHQMIHILLHCNYFRFKAMSSFPNYQVKVDIWWHLKYSIGKLNMITQTAFQ